MIESETRSQTLTIDWGESGKDPDGVRRWLGAWLVTRDGMEGDFFYDGPGGGESTFTVPPKAVGLRLRWWAPLPKGESNAPDRGRTNASRPYYFSDDLGPEIVISALSVAP